LRRGRKSSKGFSHGRILVANDLTENVVRDVGLAAGLVDVKVVDRLKDRK
jgi:hypothetical protein